MKLFRVSCVMAWALLIPFMGQAQGEAQIPPNTEKIELSTESEAYQIGLLLRCPVCQGMPIADSPADMAQAMMKKIRTMTNEGRERQEILDYFVSRYGEWVLLKPKQEGLNWIIWIVPPLVLLARHPLGHEPGQKSSINAIRQRPNRAFFSERRA